MSDIISNTYSLGAVNHSSLISSFGYLGIFTLCESTEAEVALFCIRIDGSGVIIIVRHHAVAALCQTDIWHVSGHYFTSDTSDIVTDSVVGHEALLLLVTDIEVQFLLVRVELNVQIKGREVELVSFLAHHRL